MNKFLLLVVGTLLVIGFVSAQTSSSFTGSTASGSFTGAKSSSYVNHQLSQPSFQTYYGAENRLGTYWPILNDKDSCEARQDLILQIAPGGCQPVVVRSDLIAEQNVPVFCQIDALNINPLIDIKQIKNIRFTGKYPDNIAGVGFHPAQAALRTNDVLLGTPVVNNIGYVVVVLKRQANESALPNFVNATLSATLEYDAGNAYGVGKAQYILTPQSDAEWEQNKGKQSFFQGKYFVRLEDADSQTATVSLYSGSVKISTSKVRIGQTSNTIYVPGFYCRAAVQVVYDGFVSPQDNARINIIDDKGTDVQDVYYGTQFLDGKCTVRSIKINNDGETGVLELSCDGKRIVLQLSPNGGKEVAKLKNELLDKDENQRALKLYFDNAVKEYKDLIKQYPFEKEKQLDAVPTYGEEGLQKLISLARELGQLETEAELLGMYIDSYPQSTTFNAKERLDSIYTIDYGKATAVVNVGSRYSNIVLESFQKQRAQSKASASMTIQGKEVSLRVNENVSAFNQGYVHLRGIDAYYDSSRMNNDNYYGSGRVQVDYSCSKDGKRQTRSLIAGIDAVLCQGFDPVTLTEVKDVDKVAKIRLVPKATGTDTQTNLTVQIGIEKRAIQLSPAKTESKIKNLNESIKEWESISKNLGNVVSGLKGACFATAGVLMIKNFISGIGGEALARNDAMTGVDGWTKRCEKAIANGKGVDRPDGSVSGTVYKSLTECYNGEASFINGDVANRKAAITAVNQNLENAQKGATQSGFLESTVDTEAAKLKYAQLLKAQGVPNVPETKEELRFYSLADLRELDKAYRLKNIDSSNKIYSKAYTELDTQLKDSVTVATKLNTDEKSGNVLLQNAAPIGAFTQAQSKSTSFYTIKDNQIDAGGNKFAIDTGGYSNLPEGADTIAIVHGSLRTQSKDGASGKIGDYKQYAVIGKNQNGALQPMDVREVTSADNDKLVLGTTPEEAIIDGKTEPRQFYSKYEIAQIKDTGAQRFNNPIIASSQEVRFFGYGAYEGMPSIVPFDVVKGWYAKVEPVLGTGNQQKNYDASGLPRVFDICNVGDDGAIDDKDECRKINVGVNEGVTISGLDDKQTRDLIARAKSALIDAASQKGKPYVKINGKQMKVGSNTPYVSGVQCQELMSPEDCKILFNMCDPVICPASRCNFGGKYQVDDVIQSGIVGSALLCLPNAQEGIVVPVCLSGIQAGVDGYVSILKAHRDCLQENLNTGKLVGICDQIHSIYLCDFFWRQFAPIANVLVPKIIESLYSGGQGARGGGEYLTVAYAWENTRKSMDFFTQTYAVNSMKAFKARSIAEAGTEICKGFVSAKAPTSFKTLLEPDSPTQFFAQFDSYKFTDATIPPTAQYKVFYHIFAGKDIGVQYSVYLRDPPISSAYHATPTILVDSGFITRGGTASKTKDFTAPEGYKELCVQINDKEECGFKQVTTSFAANYLRDQYAKDQIINSDIHSEKECVYGSASLGALLTNTNLQSAAEEAALPQNFKRGIIRVCSTNNPGQSTNPNRYVEVGDCGKVGLKCWLDKQSVENAITSGDMITKNETLSVLEKQNKVNLEKQGVITDLQSKDYKENYDRLVGEKNKLVSDFTSTSGKLSTSQLSDLSLKVQRLVKSISDYSAGKLYLNVHRAAFIDLRGKLYFEVSGLLKSAREDSTITLSVDDGATSSVKTTDVVVFRLTRGFKSNDNSINYIKLDGKDLMPNKIYVQGLIIYADVPFNFDEKIGSINLGGKSGEFIPIKLNDYDSIKKYISKENYDKLSKLSVKVGGIGLSDSGSFSDDNKIT